MNYILEIKAFYDWLEVNQLPTSAIVLWHSLMHIANKTGWKDNFTVAVVVLEIKTGLKRQAVCNARTILQNKGLISFQSRGGNQTASYSMYSLVNESVSFKRTQGDTQGHTQGHAQGDTQGHTQEHAINKPNKTKQNKTDNTPLSPLQGKEEILNAIWTEHKQTFSLGMANKAKEWLQYKKEKRQLYKPQGLKQLLRQISKKAGQYGDVAVISVIEDSMANNYQGIVWDRLANKSKSDGRNDYDAAGGNTGNGGSPKNDDPMPQFGTRL